MSKGAHRDDDAAAAVATPGWVPVVALLVGLGAIASTARPLLRQHFASRAKAAQAATAARAGAQPTPSSPAAAAAAAAASMDARAAELGPVLERLRELQRRHQARHPLWYGRPTPEFVAEMRAAMEASNRPAPPAGAGEAPTAGSDSTGPLR